MPYLIFQLCELAGFAAVSALAALRANVLCSFQLFNTSVVCIFNFIAKLVMCSYSTEMASKLV